MLLPTLIVLSAMAYSATGAAAAPSPITARDDPPRPEPRPKISRLRFWGSGCTRASQADGSVDVVSADYEHVTARFRDLTARIGPGTNLTERTTFCQMSMQFDGAEPGWQVALDGAEFRGHLAITPPVTLHTYMISFFVEDAAKTTTSTATTDPATTSNGDITTSFDIPESKSVWSLCSDRSGYTGIIDVNYRVAFTTREGPGTGSYGRTGRGAVTESLYFKWRRCE
ncbi:hypothetical protein PG999_014053 [Apiospora kogelbergensis]|uniref:DUF4360 domain-containing protein n=1 Tax=Apiospora kogelbergensis TaxID=1337665 RepID=A0AAW0Q5Z7_9PEZI